MSKLFELMKPLPSPIEQRLAMLESIIADRLSVDTQQLHHRILQNEAKGRTHLQLTQDTLTLLQQSMEPDPQIGEAVHHVSTLRDDVSILSDRLTALTDYLDRLTANIPLEREVLELLKEKL